MTGGTQAPFQGEAPQRAGAAGIGRDKGTPNKKTLELKAMIEAACPGFDPAVAMAKIAFTGTAPRLNPTTGLWEVIPVSEEGRLKCLCDVTKYIHAQRKAIEHSGEIAQTGGVLLVEPVKSPEEWLAGSSAVVKAAIGACE